MDVIKANNCTNIESLLLFQRVQSDAAATYVRRRLTIQMALDEAKCQCQCQKSQILLGGGGLAAISHPVPITK
jgi:hypothetical protein